MDQEVVAGIGNLYSDEILFQACLNPRMRSDGLDPATRERLFRQIKGVLETAITCGAGTERFIDRLPRSFLIPHRQEGARCAWCGFNARRPVLLTGINDLATRGDLADRTIVVRLEKIPEAGRRTDADVREAFATAHPTYWPRCWIWS
jgi:hypothetical protein